jgi:hypothetical protein
LKSQAKLEGTASMPRQRLNKFSWENAQSSLKGYDRDGLLRLISDMYQLSPENRNFLQARLMSDPDSAKPFKKRLRAALNPDAVGKFDYDLATAKRTIREFSQASSDPEIVADLMIYAVECGNRFTLNCGDIDEDFYDGLIEIYAAAIKIVLQLPKDVRSIYRRRLEKIMESSDGIGWGYHDGLCDHFDNAFPEK